MNTGRNAWITGIGLITPVGVGAEECWRSFCEGRSGVRLVSGFDASDCSCRIGAEMPLEFDDRISQLYPPRLNRLTKRYARYALAAANLAIRDAKLDLSHAAVDRIGIYLGTGTAGYDNEMTAADYGSEAASAFDVLKRMPCVPASVISLEYRIKGPAMIISTACSSGACALGVAFDALCQGDIDVAIAGGYDFAVTRGALQGFSAAMALSERNDHPQRASRPFDKERDGFVLGDGAAILILENERHAVERQAEAYAVMRGYAMTSEAVNLIAPAANGVGMAETMRVALSRAGVDIAQVDYINAHGTGTQLNDVCETRAIRQVFGPQADRLVVSSQKSMIGHSIGASGAIEAAVSALAIFHQLVPPTINLDHSDPECDLDYVPGERREMVVRGVISNSFAFGGHNCSLVLTRTSELGS